MTSIIIKSFCYQFCLTTFIFTQESFFNQLEQTLRFKEEEAIAHIVYAAEKMPQNECLTLLKNIEDARNHIKKKLFGNTDQQYFWTPRQDAVTPKILEHHTDLTLRDLSLYTVQYANMLNIKPGIIKTAYKRTKKNKNVYAYVAINDMEEGIYKIHFCVDWFNSQNKVFPHAGHTILHELTHIIEGHPLIIGLIYNTLKPYYSCNRLTNNLIKQIHALRRFYETIADIAPLMWSSSVSAIEKIFGYLLQGGILTMTPLDNLHLTHKERSIYNDIIYINHQNISFKELIIMLNKMPNTKSQIVICGFKYVAAVPLGFGIGALIGVYISNIILGLAQQKL